MPWSTVSILEHCAADIGVKLELKTAKLIFVKKVEEHAAKRRKN